LSKFPVRFSQVDSNLLRGGEPSPKHLELLKKIGIKRIVSLDQEIGEEIDPFCKKNNIQHITLPLQDGESSAVKFLPLVAKALMMFQPMYIVALVEIVLVWL